MLTNDEKAAQCVEAFRPLAEAAAAVKAMRRTDALRLFRDGNQWCVTMEDFENLQESPAGFGASVGEAIGELQLAVHGEYANTREAARAAEHRLEHENYYRQPRNHQAREKAAAEYAEFDRKADEARDRNRILISIIDGVSIDKQIERDLDARS